MSEPSENPDVLLWSDEETWSEVYASKTGTVIITICSKGTCYTKTAEKWAELSKAHYTLKAELDTARTERDELKDANRRANELIGDQANKNDIDMGRISAELDTVTAKLTALQTAVEWVANVNAMDYEYQKKAKEALTASKAVVEK